MFFFFCVYTKSAKQEFFILLVKFHTNNNHISIYSHEKNALLAKSFLCKWCFFRLLFTKTIFSEKEIHGIIERGRMRQYRKSCSEGYEKYKK